MSGGRASRPVPATGPLRPWYGVSIAALMMGLVTIALLVALAGLRDRLMAEATGVSRAAETIGTRLATSHIWLEESLTGDEISTDDVWGGIREADRLVGAMLGERPATVGPWPVGQVADPALRRQAAALRLDLRRFAGMTSSRLLLHRRGGSAGPGTPIDAAYDRQFRVLVSRSGRLLASAEGSLERRLRLLDRVYDATLLGWATIVVVTFAGLRRHERGRQRVEGALRERDMQLARAQKMEALGRLAGGMAHDVNNHLAVISAQAELVARHHPASPELADQMAAIIAAVDRSGGLIRRLLAFGRREPGRAEVLQIEPLLAGWRRLMEQTVGDGIRLELRIATDLHPVLFDPEQLEQMVINLLLNAREAMAGAGEVVVTATNVELPAATRGKEGTAGRHVLLRVRDSGPGIPASHLDRVFEPFFTTKAESGNSGLGLATMYGLAEQNGGFVTAANAAGGGAELSLYLPRASAAGAAGAG